MSYLYLFLNLVTISIPFLFSFHPNLKFYKQWKPLFFSIVVTILFFIPWDIIFTNNGVWGFNDYYLLGIKILNLPLEEWLFFVCIPYACVFTHYSLLYYFPSLTIDQKKIRVISLIFICVLFIVTIFNYNKLYTLVNFSYAILLILIVFKTNRQLLSKFYITFLALLIPFFIVNGILTGSFIENEVVWYNNDENLGIRLYTIPLEDSVYAFSLILTNLALLEYFQKKLLLK